jgi:hypothetical protein
MNLLGSFGLLNELEEISSDASVVETKPIEVKKDYNKMTIPEQLEYRRLRKLEKQNKIILASQYSQTHEWSADGEISKGRAGTLRGSYAPMAGNCKRCGNHYQLFKLNPVQCPNQKK